MEHTNLCKLVVANANTVLDGDGVVTWMLGLPQEVRTADLYPGACGEQNVYHLHSIVLHIGTREAGHYVMIQRMQGTSTVNISCV